MRDKSYALTYAYIYTILVAIILLTPLFIYTSYIKKIQDIKNEYELKNRAHLIVKLMQEHNSEKDYFEYPRFKTFKSGLYDSRLQEIFSLIQEPIKHFREGYHIDGSRAYYVMVLPEERYFGAKYIVVENQLSYYEVYEKALLILLSIVTCIFLLSILFLDRFAKPFKEVNKKLDEFIKDSIHEINTPLAIINVNVDLYGRKYGKNKYMQRIKASTKVLSNIYNDMEYLTKNNKLEIKREKIDIKKFLDERIEYFSEIALMKNISILSDMKNEVFINMDVKQLQRIVDNNISNAIKYSYEQNIIEVNTDINEEGEYLLSFRDYGIGIDNVERIFERYYRESRQVGGFGIGLNIVGAIIKKENIDVSVESELKKGTTFTYKFPKNLISIKN
ncbi:histidine kinase [Sulfurimonas denitrificans DSM 1251]|uniref:histidine kinase n=1 Tax=Sulfurimonas denitrificans (strain ATCC 33889 / DSM 1251) TaxID=326298 RepID=Q30TZ1_SULDN|nr:HAMP domain-containing sensor histidine kinase [Sulfurimonas denitrificans]ABB43540.1 histidine kinase [Sulfurimonas denitrificans DSM 1251]MDD3443469.1 HAMP domain-containing sensor histidine kinase [Sulfurimonas denitrificans]